MDDTVSRLQNQYALRKDHELINLYKTGGLTDVAQRVLLQVLQARGIDIDSIDAEAGNESDTSYRTIFGAEVDPTRFVPKDGPDTKKGIGGCLLFLAVGLWLSLLLDLFFLFTDYLPVLTQPEWRQLADPTSPHYVEYWKELVLFESLGVLILVGTQVLLLIDLHKKRMRFPALYIVFLLYSFAWMFLTEIFYAYVYHEPYEGPGTTVIRRIVTGSIWIVYLRMSKRVQNTFVNPVRNKS